VCCNKYEYEYYLGHCTQSIISKHGGLETGTVSGVSSKGGKAPITLVQWSRLDLSTGPNWVRTFAILHMMTETDPVSETLLEKKFQTNRQCTK
jgi:hypothetical protein